LIQENIIPIASKKIVGIAIAVLGLVTLLFGLYYWRNPQSLQKRVKHHVDQNGPQNGIGKWIYSNGNVANGKFDNGKLNGPGFRTRPNATLRKGEAIDIDQIKSGLLYAGSEFIIEKGEFKNDKLDGHGEVIYLVDNHMGLTFEGQFKEGKLVKGTKLLSNGIKHEGLFEEGELAEGSIVKPNGEIEPKFKNAKI
jgi:hypothetical protein